MNTKVVKTNINEHVKEQLQTFGYQFKSASTVFNKSQMALTGKVGGMRDDLAMCLQLAVYHTKQAVSG
jgi:hypothetical protein